MKVKQTDYTKGGRDISNTAIPLYQNNLTRMDEYLADPMAAQDEYMNKYYNANTAQNTDFRRAYQRDMAKMTANNYAATNGGYSSLGNRSSVDNQRNWNDAAARLYQQGVDSAYNMANTNYQNMLSANSAYANAYKLGEDYSRIDQFNDQVDQANAQGWNSLMDAAGDAGMSAGNPWGMAIGAALKVGAGMTRKDMTLSSPYASSSGNAGASQQSSGTSQAAGMFGKQMTDIISGIYNAKKAGKSGIDIYKPSVWQSLAGGKNG